MHTHVERNKAAAGDAAELSKFTMSKDGYMSKQTFLQRADAKQFEIERAGREAERRKRERGNT
jgi:hypothetical protein